MNEVTELSVNSSLYKTLDSKNRILNNMFYITCPMFISETLIGYTAALVYLDDGEQLSRYLQDLKLLSKESEKKLSRFF